MAPPLVTDVDEPELLHETPFPTAKIGVRDPLFPHDVGESSKEFDQRRCGWIR
jgi:hypothetical protein